MTDVNRLTAEFAPNTQIPISSMKDGEIGIIVRYGNMQDYIGRIVQRHENDLINIGMHSGNSWLKYFVDIEDDPMRYAVRLLVRGDKICL